MTTSEPTTTEYASYECQECGFKGDVEIINKTVTCPVCGTVNDVWKDGETPPPNHRSEPTTGEIVDALKCCGLCENCSVECFYSKLDCGIVLTDAADRLERQERENKTMRGDSFDATSVTNVLAYLDTVMGLIHCADGIKDLIVSMQSTAKDLTARAEQAEAREKAAVKDLEELLAQEDFMGVCWACENRTQCDKNLFAGGKCEPKWRGLPQDGEGLK